MTNPRRTSSALMMRKPLHFTLFAALLLAVFSSALPLSASDARAQARHTATVGHGYFILDGKPVQIISGSIHYARVPRPYWRDRLLKAKAMGLNAITVYAFWNVHEPRPGEWDFSGQYDIAQFIRIAQQVGLYVILRPGPYACAEWSFGGYPAWLLKNPAMRVRSLDPGYLRGAQSYMNHLGQQLRPLLWTHGGPIIAVQVENEYGSFGKSRAYLEAVRQMIIRAGLGGAVLYTADGPGLWSGSLSELPEAIDVGPGYVQDGFRQLLRFRPRSRLMYVAEYYPGWFDQWGLPHHTAAPIAQQLSDLSWILSHGYSVSLYMFHGGTDWGFLNGANVDGKEYEPQTTSYDYSAPLDEAGDPTQAYYALRNLFRQYAPDKSLPPVPALMPLIHVAPFTLARSASLWSSLPAPQPSTNPLDFASFDLQTGYMLYRTVIHGPMRSTLDIGGARDYDVVYINGHREATLDRRFDQHQAMIDIPGHSARLDILVEDTGRINYGPQFPTDRKGLIFPVLLNGKPLHEWENYPLPMEQAPAPHWSSNTIAGPVFHQGQFTLTRVGDTYLDVSQLGKGLLWVNGHAVGRIWHIGPQQSDYLPGCWLHKGTNTVTVFDLDNEAGPEVSDRTSHVYALHP
ncbi:MAG TPA: glycoside hydrolase family 35 protein [Acidobacteriaceae bacterium]|nr:glycoside hydrolase family 35 protein [Acidobacteriaceae bacterium]